MIPWIPKEIEGKITFIHHDVKVKEGIRLSNPTLIERALLIQEISSSLILPIYFFNRLLSIVVICSNNAIDGMDNAE